MIIPAKCNDHLSNGRWSPRQSRAGRFYRRTMVEGRGYLIEYPRPGCPTLSGVVAATWRRGRPDMSYESVVLHGGETMARSRWSCPSQDYRPFIQRATNVSAGIHAVAFAAVSSISLYVRSKDYRDPTAARRWIRDIVWDGILRTNYNAVSEKLSKLAVKNNFWFE